MLAMQYSFTLPADYDMTIIERRIADNGHRLDGYPGLLFKTYLYARKADAVTESQENVYAPFYLWQDAASMNHFLLSAGFEAVTRAFGWPEVKVYPVLAATLSQHLDKAKFASRQLSPIKPYGSLNAFSEAPLLSGSLAQILAWDTATWQRIRLSLWQSAPEKGDLLQQDYQIGHISLPVTRA